MDFSDYILQNYIDFDANFGSELWASELDNSPRTTNGASLYTIIIIIIIIFSLVA